VIGSVSGACRGADAAEKPVAEDGEREPGPQARIKSCLEAITRRAEGGREERARHDQAVRECVPKLVAIGKPAVPAIIHHVESRNDVESLFPAVEVLKEIGDPRAVPVLLALLDRKTVMLYLGYGVDPRMVLRFRVIWALGELGDVRALPKLKTLAAGQRHAHAAAASIRMIEALNDEDRTGALMGLMKSAPTVNSVRGWAAEALQPVEDPRVNPALIEMLASKDVFLQNTALKVIARRKAVEAVPAVIDLIGTKADLRRVRSALRTLVGKSPNLSALDYKYNPEKARKAWRALWETLRDRAEHEKAEKGGA